MDGPDPCPLPPDLHLAYHFNLVRRLRVDLLIVDEHEQVGGVAGTPDLHVNGRRADEERRKVEQLSTAEELVGQYDH